MNITQSKRRIVTLLITTVFLVISMLVTTTSAKAYTKQYFCPFSEEKYSLSKMQPFTMNLMEDDHLIEMVINDKTYTWIGKLQKITIPADATVTLAVSLDWSDYEDDSLYFEIYEDPYLDMPGGILCMADEDETVVDSYDLKAGTYYIALYRICTESTLQDLIDTNDTAYLKGRVFAGYQIIPPKKVSISSMKSSKKATAKITWKKTFNATGYQIMIAQNKSFTKGKKTVTAKSSTTNTTFKKLKSKKTYYGKVRAYKKVNGKTYYGKYSSVKKVKVK